MTAFTIDASLPGAAAPSPPLSLSVAAAGSRPRIVILGAGFAGLALGMQRIKLLIEAFLSRFAGVNGAANGGHTLMHRAVP